MTDKPELTKDGLTFFPIPDVNDSNTAFGLGKDKYFDRRKRPYVPKKYENMIHDLFFSGGTLPVFKSGVDRTQAARYLNAMLRSWAPAHESKVATAAYALWVWAEGDIPT